jgi:hypothetical protein
MGRKGAAQTAKARAEHMRRAALRADLRAKAKFEDSAEKLAQVIIDAALGNGDFKALNPRERATFAVKGLEYAVGRPRPTEPTEHPEEQGPGLTFSAPVETKDAAPAAEEG